MTSPSSTVSGRRCHATRTTSPRSDATRDAAVREEMLHALGANYLEVKEGKKAACLGGAQWIQDSVLKPNANLKIQVYAVWFSMLPTDSPEAFPDAQLLMSDPRVRHYWDSRLAVGARYKTWVPSSVTGPIEWDAFYLYSADAVWSGEAPPAEIVAGRTILETRRSLAAAIAALTP